MSFELADGRLIGFPDDSFAPDVVWLDHARLKVGSTVKPGEQFTYRFDLGDNWRNRCVVEPEKADPADGGGSGPRRAGRALGVGVDP
jgi:hypothetical protein